ncbi:MAG: Outer membrane protein assembly factor BamB [Phycisphaerae bacterium]|nr:Outer membrane protein assembly factor BamB [Phycisphaerae bacterium]
MTTTSTSLIRPIVTCRTVLALLLTVVAPRLGAAGDWTHLAGDRQRSGLAEQAPRTLQETVWNATPLADEELIGMSSPVAFGGRVFIAARVYSGFTHVNNAIIAFHAGTGARQWRTLLAADVFDSWSSPAVDVRNGSVVVVSGKRVYALNVANGAQRWERLLTRNLVNASPVVTDDLMSGVSPANRVFVTDFDGFNAGGSLHAINVDSRVAGDNPYDPGQVVWSVGQVGSSGNSPAYEDGVVYVASVGGLVRALNASSGSVIWQRTISFAGDPQFSGFYGGVCVRNGAVFLASYIFDGTGDVADLYKLDAATGDVVWSIPCERTVSIPVVTDDGRIFLPAGLEAPGSAIKVQAFRDDGVSATKLWDTDVDSAGGLVVGGWNYHAAFDDDRLYVGTPDPFAFFQPYVEMNVLDVTRTPDDPFFVAATQAGSGGTPAIASGIVYSVGVDGLVAVTSTARITQKESLGAIDRDWVEP